MGQEVMPNDFRKKKKHFYKSTETNADAKSNKVTRMNKKNMIYIKKYTAYYCKTIYKSDLNILSHHAHFSKKGL